MAYTLTKQGRVRSEEIARASTRYAGPAPVSMAEYRSVLAEAAKPGTLDLVKVNVVLAGIELAPGVAEAGRAAGHPPSSIFIYGAPLDRLLVPLEQEIDYMNLTSSGRKVEVPFWAQLALSTNLRPGELLDEAYLRRLSYKVLMPDPTWEMWCRIFERERERLTVPPNPAALDWIRGMYGGRPLRGNHPRDLLERLIDVSSARGQRAELSQELVLAAWQTLFIAG